MRLIHASTSGRPVAFQRVVKEAGCINRAVVCFMRGRPYKERWQTDRLAEWPGACLTILISFPIFKFACYRILKVVRPGGEQQQTIGWGVTGCDGLLDRTDQNPLHRNWSKQAQPPLLAYTLNLANLASPHFTSPHSFYPTPPCKRPALLPLPTVCPSYSCNCVRGLLNHPWRQPPRSALASHPLTGR